MRMRPQVDALAGAKFRRSEMVEEDEGADHAPIDVGQGATHREMAYVHAARHDHEVDRIGGLRIAGRRVLGRKEAHRVSLRCDPQPKSAAGYNDSGLDQVTSSGSFPVGFPPASTVIFSPPPSPCPNTPPH